MKTIPQISDLARRQCKVPVASKNIFYKAFFSSNKPKNLLKNATDLADSPKNMLSLEKAARKLRRAISSGLDAPMAYSNLAIIYLQMRKIPSAVVIAEHLSSKGFDIQANFIAGMAFLSMARMNKTEADAILASDSCGQAFVSVKIDGQIKHVLVDKDTKLKNVASTVEKQLMAAIECFEASDKAPIVLFNTAFAYQMLSQHGKAIEKYNVILLLPLGSLSDKMLSSAHNNIGVCHYKRYQIELAEKAFSEAIKYNSIAAARANLEIIHYDDVDIRRRAGSLQPAELYFDLPSKAHQ